MEGFAAVITSIVEHAVKGNEQHLLIRISMMSQQEVDSILPSVSFVKRLDVKKPRSIGPFGAQNVYSEVKQQQEEVLEEIWTDFDERFGRRYNSVEDYRTDDAEVILVTMGAIGETARTAVDEMREDWIPVGLARIRLWRPFPCERLVSVLENAATVAVIDRMMSPGAPGGTVGLELRSLFYDREKRPKIITFVAGLGGREINRRTFKEAVRQAQSMKTQKRNYTLIDVRSL
jgi:pyruvate ferredoxin oxidoreductase alpha subunit